MRSLKTALLATVAVALALFTLLAGVAVVGAWQGGDAGPRSWDATSMHVAFGQGELVDDVLTITGTQQNIAVVRLPVEAFPAGDYVYAELELENESRDVSVMLTWNGPSPERSVELNNGGVWAGLVRLDKADAWTGQIGSLELVVGGPEPTGVGLKRFELSANGAGLAARHAVADVTRVYHRAASISAIDFSDARRGRHVQLTLLGFSVSLLALLWFAVLCGLSGNKTGKSRLTLLALFLLVGWVLLDLRWQWELAAHTNRVWEDYAGKPWLERYAAMGNGELAEFLFQARAQLPDEPQWVSFSGPTFNVGRRGPHFLYPHSAIGSVGSRRQAGDFIVLFRTAEPLFDPRQGVLHFRDGTTAPAREVWRNPQGAVYEVLE